MFLANQNSEIIVCKLLGKDDTIRMRSNTTLYKKIRQMPVQLSKERDKT